MTDCQHGRMMHPQLMEVDMDYETDMALHAAAWHSLVWNVPFAHLAEIILA